MPTHTRRIDTPIPMRLHQSFPSIWLCFIHLNWIISNFQQTKISEKMIKATTQLKDNNGDWTKKKATTTTVLVQFFSLIVAILSVLFFPSVCPVKLQNSLFSPFFYCITYGLSLSTDFFFSRFYDSFYHQLKSFQLIFILLIEILTNDLIEIQFNGSKWI